MAARAPGLVELERDVLCLGPHGRTQTNVYLVRGGTGWVLVDAGWAGDADWIAAALRPVLGPNRSPTAIVATHAHPDHTGAARELATRWDCEVMVHPAELPIALGDFAAMTRYAGPLDRWVILPVMRAIGAGRREAAMARASLAGRVRVVPDDDCRLDDGGTLATGPVPGLEGWRWLHTPGHTPGSITLVRDLDRVVLTGDALVTLRVNSPVGILAGSQGISGPPRYTTWSWETANRSIGVIARVAPSLVGGGHGTPIRGPDVADRVAALAEAVARRHA